MNRKSEEERAFSSWLCNIEGIGRKSQRRLIREAGSARAVYGMKEEELGKIITPDQLEQLLISRERGDVWENYQKLCSRGIRYVPQNDPEFPRRLTGIPDPPAGLYVIGELPEESCPAVAVIGARACSEYGRMAAWKFAGTLAASGVNVISGLARGIDGIGQEAALARGGKTYAVMGCGVDICYPQENRSLYERIRTQGGILSESPPGTLPVAGLFPQRNRIISGLADVVLVVEAREKSGTLITVDMALEQGREVAVVPGRITDRLSIGCNRLLRQGAALALEPEDILQLLADFPAHRCTSRLSDSQDCARSIHFASPTHQLIYETLDFIPQSVSQICRRLENKGESTAIPQVMHILMELLAAGLCIQDSGCFSLKGEE